MKKSHWIAIGMAFFLSAFGPSSFAGNPVPKGAKEVTDEERAEKLKAASDPVRRKIYLGFGPVAMGNLNTSGAGFDFAGGYVWDVEWILFKIQAELGINGAAYMGSATLGANYFFEFKDLYPYLAADFGAGLAKIDGGGVLDGATVGGFVLGGGGGLQILRFSSVNFDLGFRVGAVLHNNALGIPLVYTIKLGMYF